MSSYSPSQPVTAAIQPPEGYRLLTRGETIRAQDIYLRGGKWIITNHTGGRWNPNGYWPMARALSPETTT